MELVWMIRMCLNETYNEACIGKYLSDNILIQTSLQQGDVLSPELSTFL
jgi:hypothetical protein